MINNNKTCPFGALDGASIELLEVGELLLLLRRDSFLTMVNLETFSILVPVD
jgi:hypothetical protein